jgi:hypothetical protein
LLLSDRVVLAVVCLIVTIFGHTVFGALWLLVTSSWYGFSTTDVGPCEVAVKAEHTADTCTQQTSDPPCVRQAHHAHVRPPCYFILPSVPGKHTVCHVGAYTRQSIVCHADLCRVACAGRGAAVFQDTSAVSSAYTAEPSFLVVNEPYLCGFRSTYPNKLG